MSPKIRLICGVIAGIAGVATAAYFFGFFGRSQEEIQIEPHEQNQSQPQNHDNDPIYPRERDRIYDLNYNGLYLNP